MKPERFVKKPIAIEAMPWTDTDECREAMAAWFDRYDESFETRGPIALVETANGRMEVHPGDVIIRGTHDFYPCKPEVFAATYEAVS